MAAHYSFEHKIGTAILGGLIVGISATAVDLAVISYTREVLIHQLIGDFIATLVAVLVCLALQLRNEELHYRLAMERAAIVAELNHHVRNAVFPLRLAVQRQGDAESLRLSNDAMDRLNVALQEAATDVFAMKTRYGAPPILEPVKEQRIA